MVSTAGGIVIAIVVVALVAVVGWIVFSRMRARKLGVSLPTCIGSRAAYFDLGFAAAHTTPPLAYERAARAIESRFCRAFPAFAALNIPLNSR